jgi:hypothetical protein
LAGQISCAQIINMAPTIRAKDVPFLLVSAVSVVIGLAVAEAAGVPKVRE